MKRQWDPEIYKETASLQHRLGVELIERLLPLKGDESILDVGCGDGFLTQHLAEKLPDGKIIGVDPSEGMIRSAASSYDRPNLNFACMGAENINYENQFDCVVSFSAMMWVKEQLKALKNIHRALKEKGKLLILFWPWTDLFWLPAIMVSKSEKWAKRFEHFSHDFNSFDISGYRILLEHVGFEIKHSETIFDDLRYETLEQYGAVISSFSPYVAYIDDPEERKMLLDDIVNSLLH